MKKKQSTVLMLTVAAALGIAGCGRSVKKSASAAAPTPTSEKSTDDGGDEERGAPVAPIPASADLIKSDGQLLGLRSGEQYLQSLMFAAGLKPEELERAGANQQQQGEVRGQIALLLPTLPKSGGGLGTFTAGHITNGAKVAYYVCNAWVEKASRGEDSRFPSTLPWRDGGPATSAVATTTLAPVFRAAMWGTDMTEENSATLVEFNEGLANEVEDPANPGNMADAPNFKGSAVANCLVYAIALPAWIL